jgi:hypothetical protein
MLIFYLFSVWTAPFPPPLINTTDRPFLHIMKTSLHGCFIPNNFTPYIYIPAIQANYYDTVSVTIEGHDLRSSLKNNNVTPSGPLDVLTPSTHCRILNTRCLIFLRPLFRS